MLGPKDKKKQNNQGNQSSTDNQTDQQFALSRLSFPTNAVPANRLDMVMVALVYLCKAPDGATKVMPYQTLVELVNQGLQPRDLRMAVHQVDKIKDGIAELGARLNPAGEEYWRNRQKAANQRDHKPIIDVPFADRDPNEQQYDSPVLSDDALRAVLQVAFSDSEIDMIIARLHSAPPNNGAPAQPPQPGSPYQYPYLYPPYPYPAQPPQAGAPTSLTQEEVERVLDEVRRNPNGSLGLQFASALFDAQLQPGQAPQGQPPQGQAPQGQSPNPQNPQT